MKHSPLMPLFLCLDSNWVCKQYTCMTELYANNILNLQPDSLIIDEATNQYMRTTQQPQILSVIINSLIVFCSCTVPGTNWFFFNLRKQQKLIIFKYAVVNRWFIIWLQMEKQSFLLLNTFVLHLWESKLIHNK